MARSRGLGDVYKRQVLDTPQEKQPSKNLESLLGVRIIGDPIPKEKKDLKHPLWGPRIKQVIEPLQALAPKDIKFFVDDNEQVDYIWVLFEQSAKWCMKVYLDKVEIMHNCNPNFNTYSPISTDDLVLEFIRFLERSTNPSFHKNEFLPPKEGVVVGNTNTIPKEGVLVDTKENKEEKVLLRDEALKHPLWGPRIKEVIEPLQALVLKDKDKDAELCWDSVDFKNGVGSIWAW
jgi:hypothetical protein